MDTKRLNYFAKIVETGSISRAASFFNIAQPAMSQHVAILESEMRARLFTRSAQGTVPTAAGEALYRHARIMLRQLDEAQAELRTLTTGGNSVVAVGFPTSTALLLGARLLQRVHLKRKDIKLQLTEATSGFVVDMMLNHRLDLAIVFDNVTNRALPTRPLWKEELLLVVPTSADLPDVIPVEELGQFDYVLPVANHASRAMLNDVFAQSGMLMRVVAEVDSLETLVAAVKQGVGLTVLPWTAVRPQVEAGEVRAVKIADGVLARIVSLCTSNVLPRTAAVTWVEDVICQLAADHINQGHHFGVSPPSIVPD